MSRHLTLLLTDIAGFTARAQALPRDGMKSLLESHRRALLPVIAARGGKVIKEMGDAFLIVFESPTDALIAAKELRDAAAREESLLGPLPIRVVAAAGDVTEIDGDVFGDAVNLAARLEGETPAGRIWVTNVVAHSVKRVEVDLMPIGERTFKGFSEPVTIFEAFSPEAGQYFLSLDSASDGPHTREATIKKITTLGHACLIWDKAAAKWCSPSDHPHFEGVSVSATAVSPGANRSPTDRRRINLAIGASSLAGLILLSGVAYYALRSNDSGKSKVPAGVAAESADVKTKIESPATSPKNDHGISSEGVININTASKDALEAHFKHRGSVVDVIIAYRSNHGPFKSVEELRGAFPTAEAPLYFEGAGVGDASEVTRTEGIRRINLNTASEAELAEIPYIGKVSAKNIVAYRTENGPFSSLEEITLVTMFKGSAIRKTAIFGYCYIEDSKN